MSYTLNQLPWLANFADLTFTIVFSDVICQCEVDNQWGSWHKLMHHKWYCLLTDSLLASLLIYLSRVLFARRGSNIVRKESTTWMDPLKISSDKSYCVRTSQNIAIKYHKAKSTLISERTKENSDCFITLGFCCEKKKKKKFPLHHPMTGILYHTALGSKELFSEKRKVLCVYKALER